MSSKRYTPSWPEGYDLRRDGITQSLLQTFMACPRKGLYAANRWEGDRKGRTTQFGSLVHAALDEMYHCPAPPEYDGMKFPKLIARCAEQFRRSDSTAEELERLELDAVLAAHVLFGYGQHYADDWTKKTFTFLEEPLWRVPFRGFTLNGKIDGVYVDNDSGKVWLLETKTSSRIDEVSLDLSLGFDFQNLFYLTMYEERYGVTPAGMLYNVIRKPGHKRKAGESLAAFGDRIGGEIAKDPEYFYKRWEIVYTNKNVDEFQDDLEAKLWGVDMIADGIDHPYRNQTACMGRYGACGCLEACATGTTAGMRQKEKLFEELQ